MTLQAGVFTTDRGDHEARAEIDAIVHPALKQAFPVPKVNDDRFCQLLQALAGRAAPGGDRRA